jgi:hypothetical protein
LPDVFRICNIIAVISCGLVLGDFPLNTGNFSRIDLFACSETGFVIDVFALKLHLEVMA